MTQLLTFLRYVSDSVWFSVSVAFWTSSNTALYCLSDCGVTTYNLEERGGERRGEEGRGGEGRGGERRGEEGRGGEGRGGEGMEGRGGEGEGRGGEGRGGEGRGGEGRAGEGRGGAHAQLQNRCNGISSLTCRTGQ